MTPPRPAWGTAAATGLAALLLYVLTLAPTTGFWDASEYIATAHILGIPHPPGNPLFVVLARSWSLLLAPTGLSVAVRINLLAAVTSALSVFFLVLVAHRLLAAVYENGWQARLGAALSGWMGATAFTVWHQSTLNEKVYTLSVLVIAAVSWLALRWRDRRDEPGSERLLLGAVFLLALGSTNHLMSVLPAPALAVLVLASRPTVLLRPRFLVRGVLLVLVGLSMNFVLPVRAAQDPVINEGDPTCDGVAEAALAVYSQGRAGCPALAANLTREQYQKPPLDQRMAPFGHQLTNWFQYFDWQWSRGIDPSEGPGTARLPFTVLFGLLGLVGLWVALRADAVAFAYLGVLVGTLTLALVYYLNFKYGYSLAPEVTDPGLHEVRERDYFFLGGFLLWGVLAGMGLTGAWQMLARLTRSDRPHRITAPVLLVALFPVVLNAPWAARNGDWAARDWAWNLLMSVEPYGVLFTNGDNDTFPLWYLQEVEGIRRDVTVVVGQYLFTSWYPRQLREWTAPERQRSYEPTGAAEVGRALYPVSPAPPRAPIMALTPAEMSAIGPVRLDRPVTVSFPEVAVQYPEGTVLSRGQQLAIAIVHDSYDERPVYFATRGGLMNELGLARWGVRQGLVVKLALRPASAPEEEGLVRAGEGVGGSVVALPRSLRLLDEVYQYRGLDGRTLWQDRATLNVPWSFYFMYLQLADAARQAGHPAARVQGLDDAALAYEVLARGGARGMPRR